GGPEDRHLAESLSRLAHLLDHGDVCSIASTLLTRLPPNRARITADLRHERDLAPHLAAVMPLPDIASERLLRGVYGCEEGYAGVGYARQLLACHGRGGTLAVWDVATGRQIWSASVPADLPARVDNTVAIDDAGELLAVVGPD